jgi:hypothetical protein
MAPRGCAEGADNMLLDASEITWYNDADDDDPIPPSSARATAGSSNPPSREPSATMLNRFFTAIPATQKIAGSRRSARVPRPSTKAVDPDNAMALKRKGSPDTSVALPRRRARPLASESDDEQATEHEDAELANISDAADTDYCCDDNVSDTGNHGRDNDNGDIKAEYQQTKSLGDADREVHCGIS